MLDCEETFVEPQCLLRHSLRKIPQAHQTRDYSWLYQFGGSRDSKRRFVSLAWPCRMRRDQSPRSHRQPAFPWRFSECWSQWSCAQLAVCLSTTYWTVNIQRIVYAQDSKAEAKTFSLLLCLFSARIENSGHKAGFCWQVLSRLCRQVRRYQPTSGERSSWGPGSACVETEMPSQQARELWQDPQAPNALPKPEVETEHVSVCRPGKGSIPK